jgi:hypothetical protein
MNGKIKGCYKKFPNDAKKGVLPQSPQQITEE